MRAAMLFFLLTSALARAGDDLSFNATAAPGPGEQPAFLVTPALPVETLEIQITAGGKVFHFQKDGLPANKEVRFAWTRDEKVTEATALIRCDFADGHTEQFEVPFHWSYVGKLTVDLKGAQANVEARTLTVKVSAPVDSADITAYGAGKAVLDQSTVPVSGGPGAVEIPWVGDPADVVLLDVQVHSGGAWAGFTYSPWFLNIPHDDVLFDSDKAEIAASETWKMEATLSQLKDVLDKYGDLVPVKLYIAGCTDTRGDAAHNNDLSLRRARAIATWLRGHGYSKPIYYHGFGESWLATPTGDEVDELSNRRAVYMVGANPPPAGSGVPAVSWTAL